MPPHRGKNLSLEIRERLLQAVNEQHFSVAEAARRLMVPESTARGIIKHYKATGKAQPKKQGGNRHPVLNDEHLNWIQEQLDKQADIRVSDLQSNIQKAFTFPSPPSCSALDIAIRKKLHYTLKLLHIEPADYNKPERILARKQWAERFADSGINMHDCIYIDESGFNLHAHISYGRSKRGQRAIRTAPSDRGDNVSYIAAMGREGIVADWAHTGSTTGTLYAWFLKAQVFPKLASGRHIIMDNARFHKTQDVRDAFAASPHTCVFLPPYSPFLNAAEWLFAHVKPRLSKEQYKNTESLFNAIRSSASTVTPAHCKGWICEVNRNLHRAMNGEVLGREYHYQMAEGDEDLTVQLLEDLASMRVIA